MNKILLFSLYIFAKLFGFKQAEFFGIEEKEKQATKVSFEK